MKILLVAMPNVIIGFDKSARFPNLGLNSLAGNVSGHEVKVVDLILSRGDIRNFVFEIISDYEPEVVGFTAMSFQYRTALELAKFIKGINSKIFTVLGGYHATLEYKKIAKKDDSKYFDVLVRGEGEATFSELIDSISSGGDFSRIRGLSFKRNGEYVHNERRGILPLENVNLPDRGARILKRGFYAYNLPADVIETSRGCTFDCAFCSITRMYGRTFRRYSMDRIMKDIKDVRRRGAKAIFIVDDNITLDLRHFEKFCDMVIRNRLNDIHYIVQASVRGISSSRRLVKKMSQANFSTVFLGIESFSTGSLEFLNKNPEIIEQAERAVSYLKEEKIIVLGGFILGNPDEKEEDFWSTYEIARKLKIDGPFFFIITPYVGTKVRDKLEEEGLITNLFDFSRYTGTKANVRTRFLSKERMDELLFRMYRKYEDLDYIKFNLIRKRYPLFFYKRLAVEFFPFVVNRLIQTLNMAGRSPFELSKERDRRRRRRWLLE